MKPAPFIARLDDAAYALGWDKRGVDFEGPLPQKGRTSFVCLRGLQVVGVLVCRMERDTAELTEHGVLVPPKYRGQGIARALYEAAIECFRPRTFFIRAVSDLGLTLVSRIRDQHPEVRFEIRQDGRRPLRRLPRKAA